MEGWIKLHRKLIEWEWYSDHNTKALFIHCLLKANIKDKTWRGINIKKGQFFTSFSNLAFELDMSVKKIRNAVSKLEKTGEIKHEGASNGTKITVCNYGTYQWSTEMKGQAEGQTKGKQGASEGQQLKNNKNIEERKEEFKNSLKNYVSKYGNDMLNAFYDYWTEHGINDKKMKFEKEKTFGIPNRLATWKRNESKFNKVKSTGYNPDQWK